jgi:hypothetical protein
MLTSKVKKDLEEVEKLKRENTRYEAEIAKANKILRKLF